MHSLIANDAAPFRKKEMLGTLVAPFHVISLSRFPLAFFLMQDLSKYS